MSMDEGSPFPATSYSKASSRMQTDNRLFSQGLHVVQVGLMQSGQGILQMRGGKMDGHGYRRRNPGVMHGNLPSPGNAASIVFLHLHSNACSACTLFGCGFLWVSVLEISEDGVGVESRSNAIDALPSPPSLRTSRVLSKMIDGERSHMVSVFK